MSAFDQSSNEGDHALDVLRRARITIDGADSQRSGVLEEDVSERAGMLRDGQASRKGGLDHLVIHVRQVHDERDVISAPLEIAVHEIEEEEGPEIPNVGMVVNGWPTRVYRGPSLIERLEQLQ